MEQQSWVDFDDCECGEQEEAPQRRYRGPAKKPLALVLIKSAVKEQKKRVRRQKQVNTRVPDPLYAKYYAESALDRLMLTAWELLRREMYSPIEETRELAQEDALLMRKSPKDSPLILVLALRTGLEPEKIAEQIPKSGWEAKKRGAVYHPNQNKQHIDRGSGTTKRSEYRSTAKRYA